ncbi:hypothetical protein QBC41DRAFT_386082 [Cercophora samala]|uniref:Uncharacterized protein n=1 Tax=Cercophora samala TaxID=330535 RepID=A0AA39ZI99_9PEZI|nr:hypothetical protein QBC41DRAFT_386082 [Cercophora samala]
MVKPPSTDLLNKGYELYSSKAVSEARDAVAESARSIYNWATNTTPSPIEAPPNRTQKGKWLQNLFTWKEDDEDVPSLESMAYPQDTPAPSRQTGKSSSGYQAVRVLLLSWEDQSPPAITRTNVMRKLENLFRDRYHFVVYSYRFQQPTNPAETIEGAFFSWLMANNLLLSLASENEKDLLITVYDGNTGTDSNNEHRLYSSHLPTQNFLPWSRLQTRLLQAPFDTLQVFNWTYHPPQETIPRPKGTNLALAASESPFGASQEFSKNDNWQLLFLLAFYKALHTAAAAAAGDRPLSLNSILERIEVAHQQMNLEEVDAPKILRLPSGSGGDENKSISISPLAGTDEDDWVVLSQHDYWSHRPGGGR